MPSSARLGAERRQLFPRRQLPADFPSRSSSTTAPSGSRTASRSSGVGSRSAIRAGPRAARAGARTPAPRAHRGDTAGGTRFAGSRATHSGSAATPSHRPRRHPHCRLFAEQLGDASLEPFRERAHHRGRPRRSTGPARREHATSPEGHVPQARMCRQPARIEPRLSVDPAVVARVQPTARTRQSASGDAINSRSARSAHTGSAHQQGLVAARPLRCPRAASGPRYGLGPGRPACSPSNRRHSPVGGACGVISP